MNYLGPVFLGILVGYAYVNIVAFLTVSVLGFMFGGETIQSLPRSITWLYFTVFWVFLLKIFGSRNPLPQEWDARFFVIFLPMGVSLVCTQWYPHTYLYVTMFLSFLLGYNLIVHMERKPWKI